MTQRVLFVCLGNICRSPTAEGVMLHLLQDRGITSVVVDSAGTSAYHVGEQADSRSQQEANRRGGIHLPSRARQFVVADFDRFDWIVAMDKSNERNILSLARNDDDAGHVYLFRDFESDGVTGRSVHQTHTMNGTLLSCLIFAREAAPVIIVSNGLLVQSSFFALTRIFVSVSS